MPLITELREKQGYQPELGTWRSPPRTPHILSLFLGQGLTAATGKCGFHPRGGRRKQKQVYCKPKRRVGPTDLLLSTFPVTVPKASSRKRDTDPGEWPPQWDSPLRQICLSLFTFWFFFLNSGAKASSRCPLCPTLTCNILFPLFS